MKYKPLLYGISTYMIWGILPLFWQLLQDRSATEILCHRIICSLIFILLFLLIFAPKLFRKNMRRLMLQPQQLIWLAIAALLIGVNWLTYVLCVMENKTSDASFAYFLSPIFTVVIGRVVFREEMKPLKLLGLLCLVSAVGVKLFFEGQLPWLAVLMAVSVALYGGIEKKIEFDPLFRLFMEMLILLPAAISCLQNSDLGFMTGDFELKLLFSLSGILTAAPMLLFMTACDLLSQEKLAIVQYLNPLLMLILAVTVFQEPFMDHDSYVFLLIGAGVSCLSFSNILKSFKKERNHCEKRSSAKSSISNH